MPYNLYRTPLFYHTLHFSSTKIETRDTFTFCRQEINISTISLHRPHTAPHPLKRVKNVLLPNCNLLFRHKLCTMDMNISSRFYKYPFGWKNNFYKRFLLCEENIYILQYSFVCLFYSFCRLPSLLPLKRQIKRQMN